MKYNIKGDFHFHSLHSECNGMHEIGDALDYEAACGDKSLDELVKLGNYFSKLGFKYIAITNHPSTSLSAKVASEDEIISFNEHVRRIELLNESKKSKINFLTGAEVNILNQDGELNLPNEVLKRLDVVVASNHRSTTSLKSLNILNGFLNAALNPHVTIIGHLTRFIKNLSLHDWKIITKAFGNSGKIVEFNLRAPFGDEILKMIIANNLLISIGSDTHPEIAEEASTLESYALTYYKKSQNAVDYLIRSGVKRDRIINLKSFKA